MSEKRRRTDIGRVGVGLDGDRANDTCRSIYVGSLDSGDAAEQLLDDGHQGRRSQGSCHLYLSAAIACYIKDSEEVETAVESRIRK